MHVKSRNWTIDKLESHPRTVMQMLATNDDCVEWQFMPVHLLLFRLAILLDAPVGKFSAQDTSSTKWFRVGVLRLENKYNTFETTSFGWSHSVQYQCSNHHKPLLTLQSGAPKR
jgi:hypothetical protein